MRFWPPYCVGGGHIVSLFVRLFESFYLPVLFLAERTLVIFLSGPQSFDSGLHNAGKQLMNKLNNPTRSPTIFMGKNCFQQARKNSIEIAHMR